MATRTMQLEKSTAWAAEVRPRDGATRQIPLLRALRLNNDAASVGELREWTIVNVFGTAEEAQEHNRRLRRTMMFRRHGQDTDGQGRETNNTPHRIPNPSPGEEYGAGAGSPEGSNQ